RYGCDVYSAGRRQRATQRYQVMNPSPSHGRPAPFPGNGAPGADRRNRRRWNGNTGRREAAVRMRGTTAERARRAGALVLLGAVAGCAAAGAGKACTEIGVPTGVSLDVAPEDASGVHAAEMEVCWDGECREPGVSLEDSRESADQGCDDGACSAKAVPTGGKHAFASLDGLP